MIKVLYAIGDSFVWGSELGGEHEADKLNIFTEYKRKHVYSALISDHYNIPNYINGANPGVSNERTYRVLLKDVATLLKTYKPDEIFVNVCLTSAMRREFCSTGGVYYPHLNAHEPPKNSMQYDLWKILVTDYNYDQSHYNFDTMLILAMQNFLKVNKVPYVITSSMRNAREEEFYKKHVPMDVYEMFNNKRYHIQPSFQTWNAIHKLPVGEFHHPLEEGHKVWAQYLIEYIDSHNLFDNSDL